MKNNNQIQRLQELAGIGGAGITLDNFEIQVIIKALQSDKVMNPDARKGLIEKLEKLRSGEYDFIDYIG